MHEIAEAICISKQHEGCTLHMKTFCAKWVLCMLKGDHKHICMTICEHCLKCCNKNKTDFVLIYNHGLQVD